MPAKKKPATKSKKGTQQLDFWTFRFTVETVYWLILLFLVLALTLWVMQLTIQTQAIYDKVQYINTTSETYHTK
jgi:hypothetical protein